ncbi:MAG: TRAM domain-containing protein, partial [Lentisphaerae bacterium]
RALIDRIRSKIPEAAIHTDLIVGFCGETEEEFEASRRVVEELEFDKIHLARYSVRPGTYAAEHLADDVPEEEKRRRWHIIDDLQNGILLRKNRQQIGKVVEVLAEGRQQGRWRGRTPQNRLVFFSGEGVAAGRLARVLVEHAGAYSLSGRLSEIVG